jgi:hypothetical protein
LVLQKTDSVTYYNARKRARADTLEHIVINDSANSAALDSTPLKIRVAGREKVIEQRLYNGEGLAMYSLLKEEPVWYLIACGYWEWGDFWFIRKSDGTEYHTLGYGYQLIPLPSPNHRYLAYPSVQGYGDYFNNGVEIFDTNTWRSVGIDLGVENDEVSDVVWESNSVLLLKMNYKGNYKVKLNALFD